MKPSRISRALRAIAVVASAALLLAGCQPAASTEKVTVGLTYTPNIQFAPFYVAEAEGYFDDAGVNVELRHHGESEDLFGAAKNGTEQLVYASGDEITQAVAGGAQLQSVATMYTKYPAVLIVPEASSIKTAEGLRGKKIGIPGPYGQTYFALLAMLHDVGMAESDVQVEHIGYTQQAALTSGKVDAVMGYINNDAVQLAASGFPVRTITAVDEAKPDLVGPAVAATSDAVASSGDEIRRVLEALKRGIEFVRDNPARAVEISAEYVPTLTSPEQRDAALATLKASVPLMEFSGTPLENDPDTWAAMAEFMATAGLADKVEAQKLYTNEFLPKS